MCDVEDPTGLFARGCQIDEFAPDERAGRRSACLCVARCRRVGWVDLSSSSTASGSEALMLGTRQRETEIFRADRPSDSGHFVGAGRALLPLSQGRVGSYQIQIVTIAAAQQLERLMQVQGLP